MLWHRLVLYSKNPPLLINFLTEVLEMNFLEEGLLSFNDMYVEVKAMVENQMTAQEWEFLVEGQKEIEEIELRWKFYCHRYFPDATEIPGITLLKNKKNQITLIDCDQRHWQFTYNPVLLNKQLLQFTGPAIFHE